MVISRLRRGDLRTGWVIAVGGAFLTTAVVFSYASGIFHPYYVSFLAPAPFTAALIGAGVGMGLSGTLAGRVTAALALVAGAITELVVLGTLSGSLSWGRPLAIAGAIVGVLALALTLAPRVAFRGLTGSPAACSAASVALPASPAHRAGCRPSSPEVWLPARPVAPGGPRTGASSRRLRAARLRPPRLRR